MQAVVRSCFTRKVPSWEEPASESVIDGHTFFTVSHEIFQDNHLWQAIKNVNTAKEVDDIIQTVTTRGKIIHDVNGAINGNKMRALYCVLVKEACDKQRPEVICHILTKAPSLVNKYIGLCHYTSYTNAPMGKIAPCIHLAVKTCTILKEFVKRGGDIYARSSTGDTTLQAYLFRNTYATSSRPEDLAEYSVDSTITQWLLRHNVQITDRPPQLPENGKIKFNAIQCMQSATENYFVEESLKKMLAEDMFLQGTLAPAILPKDLRTHIWSFLTGIEKLSEKPYRIFQLTSAAYVEERNHLIALREQERKALFDALPEYLE